jgi:PAS domain S-box-containing protein
MEQPGLLLQNQLLNQEIKRRVDQISAINMVAATVGNSLDLSATLDTALEAVTSVVGAEAAGISLIDEDAGEVVLRAQLGWINDFVVDNPMRIPLGKGMSGQVITNDDVVVHNDLTGKEEYAVPSFSQEHFRSIAMAPMHARGKIIGILSLMSHQPERFDAEIVDVLTSIADTVGVAVDNARLHEQHVEQENRLNAILHSTADGIVATDQNSRISLVNQAAATMLSVNASELIGVPLREAAIQPRVRDKLLLGLSRDATESQKFFQVSLAEREVSVLVSPVQIASQVSGESNMDGWVIVLQDITHLREAEQARLQFIQAAAHDMKNPLGVTQRSLHMLADFIDENGNDNDTVQEIMSIARTGIDRVQRLIDDLLHIEQIESGYNFNSQAVDIRELCQAISSQVQPMMTECAGDYVMQIADDVPDTVELDPDWMHRALHNYLENAVKYAPNSNIVFAIYTEDNTLHFEVRDNGPGIPRSVQSRLFERFYRAERKSSTRGSGLGLTIVKSVAEAHGGEVYLKSEEGIGSTFGLLLPL